VLRRNVELSRRYAACFDGYASAYDALLQDYDHGLTSGADRGGLSSTGCLVALIVHAARLARDVHGVDAPWAMPRPVYGGAGGYFTGTTSR
jgi:hypothetical protein